MVKRKWVTLNILWKVVSLHLFLWPTGSEWHCIFYEGSPIASFLMTNRQWVTLHTSHLVNGSLIVSLSMTNRKWVTLHILWKAVSSHLSQEVSNIGTLHILWKAIHYIFSYIQQQVSGITYWVTGSFIAPSSMTNSEWVTLYILWKAVSLHICYYDQQEVSGIAHSVKGRFITSFPITNRKWVTLHILWKAVVSLLPFISSTASEWHLSCTCWERQSHLSFPMTNSLWVTSCILWKAVSYFPMTNRK